MKKSASAVWQGGLKDGKGTISTQSGALKDNPYGFNTRFEDTPGTNPEELIAAAHAGCFTMALGFALARAGFSEGTLETRAAVKLEKEGDGFAITRSDLTLDAEVPGIDKDQFETLAREAKANCPVSKLLTAEIGLTVQLAERARNDA